MNVLAHRIASGTPAPAPAGRYRRTPGAVRIRAPRAVRVLGLALAGTAAAMAVLEHLATRIG